MEASAKLPFYYAYPNPFLCPSSLSDCNLWIRSSAGYSGAFGSSGKPGTDQIESEVGTSSKRRCGKNSGWNTERVTKPAATVAPPQRNAGPGGQPVPDQDTVSRLQIFLDEHSFGPGKIDGRWGEFLGKALQRFQAAHGQQPSGQIDSALQQELQKISPVYTTYTLTDGDLHWVGKVPSKPAGMAKLKRILYRSALDYVAERYHADPAFIRKLNSGRNLNDLKKGSRSRYPMCSRSRSKLFSLCRICRQDQSSLNASLELIQEVACSIW